MRKYLAIFLIALAIFAQISQAKAESKKYGVCYEGVCGYVNKKGKEVIGMNFGAVTSFKKGFAVVRLDKKWGVINKKGNYIINPTYEDMGEYSEGVLPAKEDGLWIFIDKKEKQLIDYKFTGAKKFSSGLAAVQGDGKWGYIGKNGRFAIKPKYEDAGSFNNGLAPVKTEKGWGYIDKKNRMKIDPQFEKAGDFSENIAAVQMDGKWGFINKKGLFAIGPMFNDASRFSEGLAAVKVGDKWGYVDMKGRQKIAPSFLQASDFSGGLAKVSSADKTFFINKKGKKIFEVTKAELPTHATKGALKAHSADDFPWDDAHDFNRNAVQPTKKSFGKTCLKTAVRGAAGGLVSGGISLLFNHVIFKNDSKEVILGKLKNMMAEVNARFDQISLQIEQMRDAVSRLIEKVGMDAFLNQRRTMLDQDYVAIDAANSALLHLNKTQYQLIKDLQSEDSAVGVRLANWGANKDFLDKSAVIDTNRRSIGAQVKMKDSSTENTYLELLALKIIRDHASQRKEDSSYILRIDHNIVAKTDSMARSLMMAYLELISYYALAVEMEANRLSILEQNAIMQAWSQEKHAGKTDIIPSSSEYQAYIARKDVQKRYYAAAYKERLEAIFKEEAQFNKIITAQYMAAVESILMLRPDYYYSTRDGNGSLDLKSADITLRNVNAIIAGELADANEILYRHGGMKFKENIVMATKHDGTAYYADDWAIGNQAPKQAYAVIEMRTPYVYRTATKGRRLSAWHETHYSANNPLPIEVCADIECKGGAKLKVFGVNSTSDDNRTSKTDLSAFYIDKLGIVGGVHHAQDRVLFYEGYVSADDGFVYSYKLKDKLEKTHVAPSIKFIVPIDNDTVVLNSAGKYTLALRLPEKIENAQFKDRILTVDVNDYMRGEDIDDRLTSNTYLVMDNNYEGSLMNFGVYVLADRIHDYSYCTGFWVPGFTHKDMVRAWKKKKRAACGKYHFHAHIQEHNLSIPQLGLFNLQLTRDPEGTDGLFEKGCGFDPDVDYIYVHNNLFGNDHARPNNFDVALRRAGNNTNMLAFLIDSSDGKILPSPKLDIDYRLNMYMQNDWWGQHGTIMNKKGTYQSYLNGVSYSKAEFENGRDYGDFIPWDPPRPLNGSNTSSSYKGISIRDVLSSTKPVSLYGSGAPLHLFFSNGNLGGDSLKVFNNSPNEFNLLTAVSPLDYTLYPGACCVNGQCLSLSSAQCNKAGGHYRGDNTACGADTCAKVPCCENGHCKHDVYRDDCRKVGGFAGPINGSCQQVACTIGTCVDRIGWCHKTCESQCNPESGLIFKAGATCEFGACRTSNNCEDGVTELMCTNMGGKYQGNGSKCADH